MADEQAEKDIKRNAKLRNDVDNVFKPVWQDISQYFLPSLSDINTTKTEGVTNWTQEIYDTTPLQAAQTCATGLRNWSTPSSEPWFVFEAPPELDANARDEANSWLASATAIAQRELARSNFYSKTHEDNLSLCTFGTGCLFAEEGKNGGLNFRQFKVGTYAIAENDEDYVDTVMREFEMTARQAAMMFGEELLTERIRKALGTGGDKKFKFLHVVEPRQDYAVKRRGKKGGDNMAFASRYLSVEDKETISEGGYEELPYMVSRFSKWGKTPWGYSPAFLALPEARQTNYVVQYQDALAELLAFPRVLIPQSLSGDVDMRPGGTTVFDDKNPNGIPREWMTQGSYPLLQEVLKDKRDLINRAFFVQMFTMLEQLSDKRMTAYEIAQRLSEKLEQFTPVFDRQVTERINPLLRRVFNILMRQGKFGAPPASLMVRGPDGKPAMAQPEVAITSRIALALRASQNQGIVSTFSAMLPIAQSRPDILDNFDLDATVRVMSRNYGAPSEILKDIRKRDAERQARAKQMAQQQAIENAQGVAKAGKDASKASPDMQSAMLGGM